MMLGHQRQVVVEFGGELESESPSEDRLKTALEGFTSYDQSDTVE